MNKITNIWLLSLMAFSSLSIRAVESVQERRHKIDKTLAYVLKEIGSSDRLLRDLTEVEFKDFFSMQLSQEDISPERLSIASLLKRLDALEKIVLVNKAIIVTAEGQQLDRLDNAINEIVKELSDIKREVEYFFEDLQMKIRYKFMQASASNR